jgi:hypothetical protein
MMRDELREPFFERLAIARQPAREIVAGSGRQDGERGLPVNGCWKMRDDVRVLRCSELEKSCCRFAQSSIAADDGDEVVAIAERGPCSLSGVSGVRRRVRLKVNAGSGERVFDYRPGVARAS